MNELPEKVKIETDSPSAGIQEALKKLIPGALGANGTIDAQVLADISGLEVTGIKGGPERFGLMWAGRSQAVSALQTPSMASLAPQKDKSQDWENTRNVFIEGDNLEVLKLLQKAYNDKVKMIYIDPPYNTGKDFVYQDDFSQPIKHYLEITGQSDSEGNRLVANTETSGRKHSNWLSMMYPRLILARNLLTEDGVILISISDIEHSNLRLLCDEVFGSYNFVANFVWLNQEGGGGSDSSLVRTKHEYILCYARDVSKLSVNGLDVENQDSYTFTDEYAMERGPHKLIKLNSFSIQYSASLDYPISGPTGESILPSENGKRGCWRWSKQKLEWGIQNGFVVFKNGADGQMRVYTKQYLLVDNENEKIERKQPPLAVIKDYSSTMATKELEKLLGPGIFDYSKPYQLLSHLVKIFSNPGDIVLDFFAGSATIGQAVTSVNIVGETPRRYIAVTLDEETPEDSRARKSGYQSIPEISRDRLKKSSINNQGFRSFKLSKSCFLAVDSGNVVGDLFAETLSDSASDDEIAAELFLKNGVSLDEPWETLSISSESVQICGGVAVCLSRSISTTLSEQVLNLPGIHTVIFLEDGFKNDSIKVDAFFSFKQANITMKTI